MKTLIIGDIHGLSVWKKLIEEHKPDKVIFLGDYVDSFIVPDSDMIQNLRDIIKYKKDNPKNTILLWGNHDIQYLYDGNNCSGRRPRIAPILNGIYKENEDLFKICHQEGKYLFSHAGITEGWESQACKVCEKWGIITIEEYNKLLHTSDRDILFQCGVSRGGYTKFGGPLWADKSETEKDSKLFGLTQVVGHTPVKEITYTEGVIYCDNLERGDGKPLILDL